MVAGVLGTLATTIAGCVHIFTTDGIEGRLGEIAGILIGMTVAMFAGIVAILIELFKLSKNTERVKAELMQDGRLSTIKDSRDYLTRLLLQMRDSCKDFSYLMYFADKPVVGDSSTDWYWENYVKLVRRGKKDGPLYRRIATVDHVSKLDFILEKNRQLLVAAKSGQSVIRYQIALYPFAATRPPQVDIVDSCVFLFSPYHNDPHVTRDFKKSSTSEKSMVKNLQHWYESIWKKIDDAGFVLLNLDMTTNGGRVKYSQGEIENCIMLFRLFEERGEDFVPVTSDLYEKYFEGVTDLTRQQFEVLVHRTTCSDYIQKINQNFVL